MFTFTKCYTADGIEFKGLFEAQPKVFGDARGYFLETYSERDFAAAGIRERFVQDNESKSGAHVLRGLHFQKRHAQGKLVRALFGRVYDVAVDLREGSATRGRYYGVVLDSERQNQFYIPRGFAHGFYVLSDEAVFAYKCTDFYHPEDEGGIAWDDPTIAIDWHAVGCTAPVLSDKDTSRAHYDDAAHYFDANGVWIGD